MLKDGEFYNKWNHCMVMALILIFDKKYSIVLWIIFHFKKYSFEVSLQMIYDTDAYNIL